MPRGITQTNIEKSLAQMWDQFLVWRRGCVGRRQVGVLPGRNRGQEGLLLLSPAILASLSSAVPITETANAQLCSGGPRRFASHQARSAPARSAVTPNTHPRIKQNQAEIRLRMNKLTSHACLGPIKGVGTTSSMPHCRRATGLESLSVILCLF